MPGLWGNQLEVAGIVEHSKRNVVSSLARRGLVAPNHVQRHDAILRSVNQALRNVDRQHLHRRVTAEGIGGWPQQARYGVAADVLLRGGAQIHDARQRHDTPQRDSPGPANLAASHNAS